MTGLLAAGAALVGFSLYARWIEPRWLEISHTEVALDGLDPAFDGYRLAFVSDIHWGLAESTEWLEDVVRRVNDLKPDLVAVGGDIIHSGTQNISEGLAILDGLRAPDGVWCVLGNHDYQRYGRGAGPMRRALGRTRIRELWNEAVPIRRGDAAFWLAGVGDLWRDACDFYAALAGVPSDEPRIVLCHNPDGHREIAGQRVDLMLSGHTHGGQVRLPFVGPIFTRTVSSRRLAAGLTSAGGTQVYVGRGVSEGKWKVRFLCPRELPVIALRAPATTPDARRARDRSACGTVSLADRWRRSWRHGVAEVARPAWTPWPGERCDEHA